MMEQQGLWLQVRRMKVTNVSAVLLVGVDDRNNENKYK
jgi:hypothetical protein